MAYWELEEVKENKETLYGRSIEEQIREHLATPSILEKLRNGLEKRKQKMIEENWWPSCIEQVVWILAVLDSLETKDYNDMNDEEIAEYHRTHKDEKFEILGHPFSHSDILEALGEDWGMLSNWQLVMVDDNDYFVPCYFNGMQDVFYPKLPSNLSDLSLPEYEETRKQLIQLLTK